MAVFIQILRVTCLVVSLLYRLAILVDNLRNYYHARQAAGVPARV